LTAVTVLVFTVLGMVAFLIAFAFGLGGAVSAVIFLAILFVGICVRVTEPMRAQLRP
jgi:hypothetical protein